MGVPVLILGESGSGKSYSLKNFDSKEVAIFNVTSKLLPFRKKFPMLANNCSYAGIIKKLKENKYKTYVIDDSQYLMAFEMFNRAKEQGYGKFTDIAINFKELLDVVMKDTSDDTIVYFLHHSEETQSGKTKMKTVGKMLNEQLTVEGFFTIVLMTEIKNGEHKFITQSDGTNPCKCPEEMFEKEIKNDLKFVDDTIREYYEMKIDKKVVTKKEPELKEDK